MMVVKTKLFNTRVQCSVKYKGKSAMVPPFNVISRRSTAEIVQGKKKNLQVRWQTVSESAVALSM